MSNKNFRQVRIFVSSTFRDMHAERDHLARFVFPKLRLILDRYRIFCHEIDLRWGVSREQAENNKVLDACLDAIGKDKPYFLGILGERYGSIPESFPSETLHKHEWIQTYCGASITELEILHGALRDPEDDSKAFFLFRDPAFIRRIPSNWRRDFEVESADASRRLGHLKKNCLRKASPKITKLTMLGCVSIGVSPH